MKIKFTKKEYRLLIDLLKVSDWVLHAHIPSLQQNTQAYSTLIQKILSYASEMGFEDLIEQDKQTGQYLPTHKYEKHGRYMQFIDLYNDNVFWSGLSYKMAIRDIIEQEGEKNVEKMDLSERGSKIMQLQEWYEEEFNNNGLQNVKVTTKPSKKSH